MVINTIVRRVTLGVHKALWGYRNNESPSAHDDPFGLGTLGQTGVVKEVWEEVSRKAKF